jgi:hypothetical protein
MTRSSLVLFILFFSLSSLYSKAELSLEGSKKSHSEYSLGFDVKFEQIDFPEQLSAETNASLSKMELAPALTWKSGETWRFYSHPLFIFNPDNKSEIEKYFWDPQDFYFKFQKNTLQIQAGYNILSWGVTDGYNPVDVVNKKQLFNPLNGKKLGVLSLLISESLPFFDYDFIYIPQAQGSLLPGEKSRWLPQDVFIPQVPNNDMILILPKNLIYKYGQRESLNSATENNFALRLQKSISRFDLSLSAFEGLAMNPLIQPQVTGIIQQISPKTVIQVDPDITLNLKDYRIRQAGFTLVSNQSNFLFKYSTSFTQSLGEDISLPGWTHESVLGLEKSFNLSEGTFVGVLQNSFLRTEKQNDSNLSFSEIFRNAWMIGGQLSWREIWSGSLMGLYNQINSSHYEEITVGRRFFDAWTLSLTANLISGSELDPLGIYHKNQSWRMGLGRSF